MPAVALPPPAEAPITRPVRRRRRLPPWLRSWGDTLVLLVFAGAFAPFLPGSGMDTDDARAVDVVSRLIFSTAYVIAGLGILKRPRLALRVAKRSTWLWVLLAWAVLSVLWSDTPALSGRRVIGLVGTTLVGFHLALRYDADRLLRLLTRVVTIGVAMTALLALAVPEIGVMSGIHEGAWSGPFLHKNPMGRFMALALVVYYLASLDASRGRKWLLRLGMAAAAGLLLLSTSKTAILVAIVLMCVVAPTARVVASRANVRLLIPAGLLAGLVAAGAGIALAENWGALMSALGRDASLTGRTLLWAVATDMAMQRPWLGYGYGGFWLGGSGPSGAFWTAVGWDAQHTHNALLDLWLDLGLIGAVWFLAGVVRLFWRALADLRGRAEGAARWPLFYLAFVILYSITESGIVKQHSLFWVLFAAVVCAQQRDEHQSVP